MLNDDEPVVNTEATENQEQPVPEKKPKKEKAKVKKAKTAKGSKKKAASAANGKNKTGRAPRIADEAKIMKVGTKNPFREGTDSYKRVEAVWKNSGQTAGTIKKKVELLPGSLSNMVKLGLIRAS